MELKIDRLCKNYGEKEVLKELSFTFEEGKIYGIIGRNGAGKTTLFNCVNQDIPFDSGTVSVCQDTGVCSLRFDDVGLVSASPVLPNFLTGYEFIHYFMKIARKDQSPDSKSIDDYFDLVRITEEDRFRLIKTYSYGMKNKLQLLCCLIRDPKVILLDEPLSSFDIIVSHDIKELLLQMKHQHIILMSTHIMQLAQDISDELILLHKGNFLVADQSRFSDEGFENYVINILKDGD